MRRMPFAHHIDSSILIEPANSPRGKICERYLNVAKRKFDLKVAIPAMGEIFLVIGRMGNKRAQYELLDFVLRVMERNGIEPVSTQNLEYYLIKVNELESGLAPMDKLLVSVAIAYGAAAFITLDKRILRAKKLEKEFSIKLMHPGEFL